MLLVGLAATLNLLLGVIDNILVGGVWDIIDSLLDAGLA